MNWTAIIIWLLAIVLVAILAKMSIKIVRQYEQGVLFRLGRVVAVRMPGLRFIIPVVDRLQLVSLRIVTMPIQSQGIITQDNVSVDISAVAYYRVIDSVKSVVAIEDVAAAINQIAQTTLRKVVGRHSLDQTLSETERINSDIRIILDALTLEWGVEVTLVELKDIQLPESMKRAMARQAEAEREKRAKIISAEGEAIAAVALGAASDTMMAHPVALQLRNLQSLVEIGVDKNSTVVFPAPLMSTIAELAAFLAREDHVAKTAMSATATPEADDTGATDQSGVASAPPAYYRGMDESALTRRRLLELAGIGLGASALTACTDGIAPPETLSRPCQPARRRQRRRLPPAPLTVRTSTGSFVSAFRPGITSHWSLAAPELPPGGAQPELPVAVFLHGLGGSHTVLLEDLAAHEALQRHLDAGGAPFAIAAVDGGNTWWHRPRRRQRHPVDAGEGVCSVPGQPGLRPWQDRPLRHLHGRLRFPPAGLAGPAARSPRRRGHESGGLGPLRPTAWNPPSTARPTSRPMTCSRSGPGSRRCPSGSTAAPGTILPPRFVRTVQDCRATSRVVSGPAATTTATGGPSCPRWCHFWATTSPEPAAGRVLRRPRRRR